MEHGGNAGVHRATGRDAGETAADRLPVRSRLFFAALAMVTLVGPLTVHLFLPVMPAIQHSFGVPVAAAQFTLSVSLLTMAGATLLYGALSDRFGRRPVLMAGLGLFTAGGAICAVAPSFELLVLGRIVQAAGGGCGVVLARAMARDVYGVDRLVRVIAWLTIAYVIGPMTAPALGGVLIDGFGWRAIFLFGLAAGAAIIALSIAVLPETRARGAGTGRHPAMLAGYWRLMRSARFDGFVLHAGFCAGTFFAFVSSASFLMTDVLHRPAVEFGLYFLIPSATYILGNYVSVRLGGRVAMETMVMVGGTFSLLSALLLAALLGFGVLSPLVMFVPGGLIGFGQGLSMPNAQSGAIAVDETLAGSASGAIMFTHMLFAALFSQIGGLLADGTPYPMAAIVTAAALLALIAGMVPALQNRRAPGMKTWRASGR